MEVTARVNKTQEVIRRRPFVGDLVYAAPWNNLDIEEWRVVEIEGYEWDDRMEILLQSTQTPKLFMRVKWEDFGMQVFYHRSEAERRLLKK